MSKQIAISDWSFAIKRPTGYDIHRKDNDYSFSYEGSVKTSNGIVSVYTTMSKSAERVSRYTWLQIVLNGKAYQRNIRGKFYTARGLVTLADRYAREIAWSQV